MKPLRLLLFIALLALSALCFAQAPAPVPVIAGPPDVVVIVFQQPGSADTVSVTYSKQVPHAQADADCRALIAAGGWQASVPAVKDAAGPMRNRVAVMTGASFQALSVIGAGQSLPVETIARALHGYRRLNLVFFTSSQFGFQGPPSSADNDIKIALDTRGTTYAYQVEIRNPNFGSLPPAQANAVAHVHPKSLLVLLGVLGVAAAAGLLVYVLTARLTPKTKRGDNNEAEVREEIGTKR